MFLRSRKDTVTEDILIYSDTKGGFSSPVSWGSSESVFRMGERHICHECQSPFLDDLLQPSPDCSSVIDSCPGKHRSRFLLREVEMLPNTGLHRDRPGWDSLVSPLCFCCCHPCPGVHLSFLSFEKPIDMAPKERRAG